MTGTVITLICMILPCVIGGYLTCRVFHNATRIKKLIAVIIGAIAPGAVAFLLFRSAFGAINPFLASFKFKIAFLILGVTITVLPYLLFIYRNRIADAVKTSYSVAFFSAVVLFIITFIIYIPSVMILVNWEDFYTIKYVDALMMFLVIGAAILAISWIIWFMIRKKIRILEVITLIFIIISIGIYVQYNFLNGDIPELTGTPVDWSAYHSKYLISLLAIVVITALFVLARVFLGRARSACMITLISCALCIMQLVSLAVTTRWFYTSQIDHKTSTYSKEGEFEIGKDHNVVLMVIDSLDGGHIDSYLNSDYYHDEFVDFDYFDNVVGGGQCTVLGLKTMLSGVEFDTNNDITALSEYAYTHTVLGDYKSRGYDCRLFTDWCVGHVEEADNLYEMKNSIDDKAGFLVEMGKLNAYSALPYPLKPLFYGDAGAIQKTFEGKYKYSFDNDVFYEDVLDVKQLDVRYDKTFRMIHIRGVHPPYSTDAKLNPIETTFEYDDSVLAGIMIPVGMYFDYLKDAGVYDNTTIVIIGDHGSDFYNNEKARPAILIKPDKDHQYLSDQCREKEQADGLNSLIDQPRSFWNFTNLLKELAGEDIHGMTLYDTSGDLLTDRKLMYSDQFKHERYRILAHTCQDFYDEDKSHVYELYDSSQVNRISYKQGDEIRWDSSGSYGDSIREGLSVNDGTAMAGYEFQMNLDISDYNEKPMTFTAEINRIGGEVQQLIVILGFDHIETFTIDKALTSGNTINCKINPDDIKDGSLSIRILCPLTVLEGSDGQYTEASVAYKSFKIESDPR